MDKTLNLINTFWEETEDVKIKRLHLAGLRKGGLCQCSADKFIRRTKDPIEMRSFLMIGVLIDQNIIGDISNEFRSVFKYPKLFSHPDSMTSQCSPSWFANSPAMRGNIDWASVKKVFEILFFDTKSWFLENNKVEDFDEFKRSLFLSVDRGFKEFPDRVLLGYMLENFFERSSDSQLH